MPALDALSTLDAAARGGAAAIFLLLALLLLRDGRRSAASLYGGLAGLSVIAYLVNSWPGFARERPLWLVPVMLISMGIQALLYLWARAWFDDEFERSWRDGAIWLGLVGLGFWCACSGWKTVCYGYQAAQLGFVALIIRQALSGRAADLIEGRRRVRMALVTGAGAYSLLVVTLEFLERGPALAAPVSAANAAGLMAFALLLALAQVSLAESGLMAAEAPRRAAPAEPPEAGAEEAALLARLRQLMEAERAYREEGLAIAGLAARLAIPEYRLRRLINQRLGHRNFSSFVNGYRLADACAALADPGQAAVPVVTIALDAGFQSLGPFNRAFKTATGMTPTDYRRRQQTAGNGAATSPNSEIGKPFPA
jgi:AraC-like DNA-binding protein